MYGTFLTALPTDVAGMLSMTANGVTVVGLCFFAIIMLWRMNKDQQKAAEKARSDQMAAIEKGHSESQALLKEQVATAHEQSDNLRQKLHDVDVLRQKEWQEHYERMEQIVSSNHESLEEFSRTMKEMQNSLREISEQTQCFKDCPSKA